MNNLAVVLHRHDELLARLEELDGALESLVPDVQAVLGTIAATGTVVDDFGDRTKLQAIHDYWANVLRRAGHEVARTRLEPFDAQCLPELDDAACPWVGSEPIRDAAHFFGREADIREIVDRLARESIVIIRAPSGAGKSSLLYAGVLPKLPSEGRVLVSMRPGASPFARFAKALGASIGRELSGKQLRNKPDSIREVLVDAPPAVLCIDQFEEMFILATDADRSAFDDLLKAFLEVSSDNRLVLCVDDALAESIARMPRLAERLDREHAPHALNPLDGAALERAIARPAAQVDLELKQGVVEHLVRDVPRGPSALSVLQFMLGRLWAARERNRVTIAALQAIGDPCEAFDRDAERRFDALLAAGTSADEIRRILLEMVRIDDLFDYHRQCARIDTVRAIDGVETATVLPLMVEHGFVRMIDGEFVEIPDEAHIHHWRRFVDWIKKQRQPSRNAREALASAAQLWEANSYSDAGLLRRTQIAEAQKLGRLTELEQRFLRASEEQIEREHAERDHSRKRSIAVLAGMVTALAGLAIALGAVLFFKNKAYKAEMQAIAAHDEAQEKVQAAQTEATKATNSAAAATQEAKLAKENTKKAKEDTKKANAMAREAQLEKQIVVQDLQTQIKVKPKRNELVESLEVEAAEDAEAEIRQASSTGEFWLQIASDNSIEDSQASLRGVKGRLEKHDSNIQFKILKRRAYYVLMAGPYATFDDAKQAAVPNELYPHGRYIRVLDSFCPEQLALEGPEIQGVAVVECVGVPPLRAD